MHTSSDLALSSPSVPDARRTRLAAVIAALVYGAQEAADVVHRALRGRRRQHAWRDDLPWNVGLDHLAEQAYRPWILRP
jgi:hypothetical protein